MLGAIIGDVVGSRYEFRSSGGKDFEFFHPKCRVTDDSVLSVAIAKAVMEFAENPRSYEQLSALAVKYMQEFANAFPRAGYGSMFRDWMESDNPQPYNSFGNGSAMRVSAVAWFGKNIKEVVALSRAVTEVTHNHPEGIKGAEAVAVAIFLARKGKSKRKIRKYISKHYYPLDFTLESLHGYYQFNETCQKSVPQAITAFLESNSYEDAIRNAVALDGDSDTLAAIAGSIAEAYYGIPEELKQQALPYIPEALMEVMQEFEMKFNGKRKRRRNLFMDCVSSI